MTDVASLVLFDEKEAKGGQRLGIATLNAPATLNGLSLEMAHLLTARLADWQDDPAIAVVILRGAGDKAFCAGGDLHALHRSMLEYRASGSTDIRDNRYAGEFFEVEYRLDYRIHAFPKPVLVWGHGYVMGGGIGLMAGASHRVVTERSRLAFPEITVGLFPDVGGSWLLNRVPDRGGVFLALTGAPLDAGDAIHAGLADVYLPESSREAVFDALCAEDWPADDGEARHRLTGLLAPFALPTTVGPLQRHAALIDAVCAHDDLPTVAAAIDAIEHDEPWLQSARATLAAGSPGSARLGFELQRRAAALSLAETFRLEYVAALHCAARGDFGEGIRALLIDKDRNPRWKPETLAAATPTWAQAFLAEPDWPGGAHPLRDLSPPSVREHVSIQANIKGETSS